MAPNEPLSLADAYHRYGDEVRAYLQSRLGSCEDAEDLAQEAFFRVHRSGKIEEVENPRAYLLRTAENLLRDRFRRDSHGVFDNKLEVTDSNFAHRSPSPERVASAREELDALARVVVTLSPKVRQALILNKFHHCSYKKVAMIMGISPKTVEKHLAKALRECRRVLAKKGRVKIENVVEFSITPQSQTQPSG